MSIGPTRTTNPRPVVPSGAAREAGRAYAARAVAATAAPALAPTADVTSIAGIPSEELTPKVRDAIELLMHEVQRMRQELDKAEKRVAYLEKLADEDSLVPVANRRAFVRELSRMVAYAERYNSVSSVLYFDIDGFKEINDLNGHAAGDAALQHIGEIFTLNVRESDFVGRLGGDEFGVILAHTGAEAAAEKAAQLADAIETTPLIWKGQALNVQASYGAYSFSGKENAGEALQRADQAMYAQKQVRAAAGGG